MSPLSQLIQPFPNKSTSSTHVIFDFDNSLVKEKIFMPKLPNRHRKIKSLTDRKEQSVVTNKPSITLNPETSRAFLPMLSGSPTEAYIRTIPQALSLPTIASTVKQSSKHVQFEGSKVATLKFLGHTPDFIMNETYNLKKQSPLS